MKKYFPDIPVVTSKSHIRTKSSHFQGATLSRCQQMLGLRRSWQCGRSTSGQQQRAQCQLALIYALKLLGSFAYFIISLTLPLYLTTEHGFDDKSAGAVYGVMGMLISIYSFPAGVVIDRLGVQRAVFVGAALTSFAGLALASLHSSRFVVAVLCTTMPASHAVVTPALATAVGTLAVRASTPTGEFQRVGPNRVT